MKELIETLLKEKKYFDIAKERLSFNKIKKI